jgi:phage protein D
VVNAVDVSRYAPRFEIIVNGTRLSADMSHVITSVEIEQQLNKLNSFKFEVQDEYLPVGAPEHGNTKPFRWLGHPLFRFGNEVSVSLGYLKLVKMAEGKIQNISATFTQGLAPSFSVDGADRAFVALTTPSEVATFRNKTDSEIAREIADRAQMEAVVDRTSERYATKIKQGGKTYFEFLEGLARANGFNFSLSGRTLRFVAPEVDRPADAVLNWGRDLLSFNPQLKTDAMFTEVVVRAWDRSGRQMIEGRAHAGEENRQEKGKRFGSQVAQEIYGDAVRVITDRPVTSQAEARKIALAELQHSSESFIEGSIEILGCPDLQPGMAISLAGLGEWFSGKYYIDKLTHRISTSGYRTTCELKRNAV